MRVWVVAMALGVVVLLSLGLRTAQGWAPTKREAWAAQCARGQLESCAVLGDDLLYGRTGPIDRAQGLDVLEDACDRRSAQSCALAGINLFNSGDESRAMRLLQRGCALKSVDACGQLGRARLAAGEKKEGLALLRRACEQNSARSCALLGDRAIFSDDVEADEANVAFARACAGRDAWGCFRQAQAYLCGRGVERDVSRALSWFREACAAGIADACTEQVELETDGGVTVSGPEHVRAIIGAAFGAAQGEAFDEARKTLAALDGGVPFAVAAVEVSAGDFAAAEVALARAPSDDVETRVLREVLRERRAGTPWPDATWLGWKRAGMPDLRKSAWLLPESFTRASCSPPVVGPVTTERAFVEAVAGNRRTRLDEPFDTTVIEAAMRYAESDRLSVGLLALGVLRETVRSGCSEALVVFEQAAREAFAAKHHDTLFMAKVTLPPVLEWSAATPADLARLRDLSALPDTLDRRALYADYVRILGGEPTGRALAFSVLVFALTTLDVGELPAWFERGGADVELRADVLRRLGTVGVKGPWLVDRYQGLRLLRASLELENDPKTRALVEATDVELAQLRSGPTGLMALGQLPFHSLSREEAAVDEIAQLKRLQALDVR